MNLKYTFEIEKCTNSLQNNFIYYVKVKKYKIFSFLAVWLNIDKDGVCDTNEYYSYCKIFEEAKKAIETYKESENKKMRDFSSVYKEEYKL